MANKRKDYSNVNANKILKDFENLSQVDPLIKSQKSKDVYFRALLYKVLMEFNYMNDRQVEALFFSKGVKRTRVAIYHAVSKIDMYYDNFADFRELYNVYFDDKLNQTKIIETKIRSKENDLNNRVNSNTLQVKADKLQLLMNEIPAYRRDEAFERLNLMVKSWSWKSKDKCEVIQGDSSVSENAW
jgi:hypothetical protein